MKGWLGGRDGKASSVLIDRNTVTTAVNNVLGAGLGETRVQQKSNPDKNVSPRLRSCYTLLLV